MVAVGPYFICSGQSRGPRHWSVTRWNHPSWRPLTRSGRVRLFASPEAAQRLADELNRCRQERGQTASAGTSTPKP